MVLPTVGPSVLTTSDLDVCVVANMCLHTHTRTHTHFIALAALKLVAILLPQVPRGCGCTYTPPCLMKSMRVDTSVDMPDSKDHRVFVVCWWPFASKKSRPSDSQAMTAF